MKTTFFGVGSNIRARQRFRFAICARDPIYALVNIRYVTQL